MTANDNLIRPNRPMHAEGPEQVVIDEWNDGRKYRLTLRQVGWIGQSGDFYSLAENPSLTERGGFSPLWFVAYEDKVLPADLDRRGLATRLFGWIRRRSQ